MDECLISGCCKPARQRGWCASHYARWYRTGGTETVPYSCRYENEKERFLESCEPVTESGCWLWVKSVAVNGYGKASYRGKSISAHRLSYLLNIGDIPNGMQILHSCDVRGCVNPAHLRAGTAKENAMDAVDRFRTGKLNREQILAIRADTRSQRKTARDFGISPTQVAVIRSRASWHSVN